MLTIKERTLIRQSEYVAYLGEHKPFTEQVATRIGAKRQLIGLGDGARWIWDFFHCITLRGCRFWTYTMSWRSWVVGRAYSGVTRSFVETGWPVSKNDWNRMGFWR